MRTAISLAVVLLTPALALADPPVKLYYVGEAKVSTLKLSPTAGEKGLIKLTASVPSRLAWPVTFS